MGDLSSVLLAVGTLIGALVLDWLRRDIYASLPRLQIWLVHVGVRQLPIELRDRYREEWLGILEELPPSQIVRTIIAIDLLRAGVAISQNIKRRPKALGSPSATRAWWRERRSVSLVISAISIIVPAHERDVRCREWISEFRYIPTLGERLAFLADLIRAAVLLRLYSLGIEGLPFMLCVIVLFLVAVALIG